MLAGYGSGAESTRERFARLHPRFDRSVADATLGDARFVVAREHGFDNWPRFRVSVEAAAVPEGERVKAFLESGWAWGDWPRAQALLALHPEMAEADLNAACVLGSEDEVARRLSRQPELAQARGGPLSWPPLLYVCWSAFLARDPGRSDRLLSTARLLLEHGADPNCFWRNAEYDSDETALYGACGVSNHAGMTELLLDAGANPNDGEALYHACEHFDTACLDLLSAHGVDQEDLSFNLKHVIDYRYADGVRWFPVPRRRPQSSPPDVGGDSAALCGQARLRSRDHRAPPGPRGRRTRAYPARDHRVSIGSRPYRARPGPPAWSERGRRAAGAARSTAVAVERR